jgi:hypothetical protein
MNGSKLAVAIIFSLVLATAASAGSGILAQTTDALKAEYMVQVMESAKAGADSALAQLQNRNVSIPGSINATFGDAMNQYQLALQYRNQANYSACNECALRAQSRFMETVSYAAALGADGTSPGEEDVMARIELRARIMHMRSVVDDLENATAKMENAGINASGVAGDLAQMRLRLENATRAMNCGDIVMANQTMTGLEASMMALRLQYEGSVNQTDALRARNYIMHAEQLMLNYEARINAQTNVSEDQRGQALGFMIQARNQLQAANASLVAGNVTDAFRLMEQFRLRMQEACGAMGEGNQTRAQLELRIMNMQMEVEGLANRTAALKSYGFNVSAQEQEEEQIRMELRDTDCTNASAEGNIIQVEARIRNVEQAVGEMENQRMVQERARIQGEIDSLGQRLGNCTQRAGQFKQNGGNVSQIELMIQEATALMNGAQSKLANGELNSAEGLVSQAGGIVSQAEGALNQMGGGGQGGNGGGP